MFSRDLIEFAQSGLSTIVGTTNGEGRPHCMRAIGIRVHESGQAGRVFLPSVAAAPTIQDLSYTRRIAVSMGELGTHRAIQLKGNVIELALANERDRVDMDRLFERLLDKLAYVGFPRAVILNVNRWPAWRVDFDVEEMFLQTPGPRAGQKVEGEFTWASR